MEQAATYAPELNIVGAALNTPVANLSLMPPFLDGNLLVGALGYVLNGIVDAYPETAGLLMGTLTPRRRDFVQWSKLYLPGAIGRRLRLPAPLLPG